MPSTPADGSIDVASVISTHAPWSVACSVYTYTYYYLASARRPDIVAVVSPDHYGRNSGVTVCASHRFWTPLGELRGEEGVEQALERLAGAAVDCESMVGEHGVETHLPWIKWLWDNTVRVAAVTVPYADKTMADAVAYALHYYARKTGKRLLVLATSDMSHYLDEESVRKIDEAMINVLKEMDVDILARLNASRTVSWCGLGAVMVAVQYAWLRDARRFYKISYTVKRFEDWVNSYAAFAFYRLP